MNVFAVMFVFFTQHKWRSITVSVIFHFMGVQTQLLRIRISMGGSALFTNTKTNYSRRLGPWGRTKNLNV